MNNHQEAVKALLKTGPKTLEEIAARLKIPTREVRDDIRYLKKNFVNVITLDGRHHIPRAMPELTREFTLVSRPDNTFCFGAFGDLHAGSKFARWDVREDLVRKSEEAGAQCIFDTGNWIEGTSHFNKYELVAGGVDGQLQLLAENHPQTTLPIFAVTGDDHEGWFAQREGIDIGAYCEKVMRSYDHDWTNMGYMEARVHLKNYNTGKSTQLAVVHPGGGSSYALSYSIQKIVESYEGGEKPAVGLYGHYHKIWAGIIRNVWVVQTGCQCDQTTFMRKKKLEAHVGGSIISLEQDPKTGAILGMTPRLLRYFNTGYYTGVNRRWGTGTKVINPPRALAGIAL